VSAVPWIKTIPPTDATGELAEAYASQIDKIGHVTELTQLGSLDPALVAQRLRLYEVVEGVPSSIPDWGRRAVALTTSILNGCLFCTAGHTGKLRDGGRGALADAIHADPGSATTGDPRVDALLVYARLLVRDPGAASEADVAALRAAGWDDLAILDVNNIAAYYSYINRVASGLGLQGVG
jgi:uncharacterized peroxidase-related enzyme